MTGNSDRRLRVMDGAQPPCDVQAHLMVEWPIWTQWDVRVNRSSSGRVPTLAHRDLLTVVFVFCFHLKTSSAPLFRPNPQLCTSRRTLGDIEASSLGQLPDLRPWGQVMDEVLVPQRGHGNLGACSTNVLAPLSSLAVGMEIMTYITQGSTAAFGTQSRDKLA
ncbi:unnamed protein product [Lota lota]